MKNFSTLWIITRKYNCDTDITKHIDQTYKNVGLLDILKYIERILKKNEWEEKREEFAETRLIQSSSGGRPAKIAFNTRCSSYHKWISSPALPLL